MSRNSYAPTSKTTTFYPLYHKEITKSDTEIHDPPVMLYVGTGGDVVVEDVEGTECTYVNMPNASTVPVLARKIKAATTASDLVGSYEK